MILLFLVALLFRPSDAGYSNSFRVHISDILRLKCDELPYRTAYAGSRCYFAVTKEANYSEASAQCSSLFPGAKLALDVPYLIFSVMMLEKSKFHMGTQDSSNSTFQASRAKQYICGYDSGYECEAGEQSKIIPGKCVASTDQYKTFEEAESYCSRLGMEVPIIKNELDNLMIRDSGAQMQNLCGWNEKSSSVIEKDGYWGDCANIHRAGMGAVCEKDAVNDFTGGRKPCIAHHALDEESGLCEWTGPKNACLQTIDYLGRTYWETIPNFPKQTYKETDMYPTPFVDRVVKVIVRRGCMYSGFGGAPSFENQVLGKNDLGYGVHNVPCYFTGELPVIGDGLSILKCFCDPTEATLNDHEPAPPPKKKCIEHHAFNETTQSCEWKHEPKFCGELITNEGRRKMVEIPNWPTNRKYDFDHWTNETLRKEDFHVSVTEVIVRQHCWMTLQHWVNIHSATALLPAAGYGRHEVRSYYNGKLGSIHDGAHRVICECIR